MTTFLRILDARALVGACLVSLAACNGSAPAPQATETVALEARPADRIGDTIGTVNGQPIGTRAFDHVAGRQTPKDGAAFSTAEKRDILEKVVDDEVLFQEAFEQQIYLDPKVRRIMVNLLLRDKVYAQVRNDDFTRDELQAYYADHKDEFVVPERRQVKRLYLKIKEDRDAAATEAKAKDLAERIRQDPERFSALATAHSEDPFARRGGDLGFVSEEGKPGVPPEVVAKAFEIDVGTVPPPFRAAGGFNIVYVPTNRDRLERTFEQMKGSVVRKLKNQRYEELTRSYIDGLRKDAAIKVDDAALAAHTPKPTGRPSLALPGGEEPRPPIPPRDPHGH